MGQTIGYIPPNPESLKSGGRSSYRLSMHWRGKHATQKMHTCVNWYFGSPGYSYGYGALKKLLASIYIQLWPLGGFKVEKYVKGVVKILGSRNTTGNTNEAHFPTLIS